MAKSPPLVKHEGVPSFLDNVVQLPERRITESGCEPQKRTQFGFHNFLQFSGFHNVQRKLIRNQSGFHNKHEGVPN